MKEKLIKVDKMDLIIFAIILLIYGAAFLAFYPAILTTDSINQIEQALTNEYTTAHPVLHSFIVGNISKITGNVAFVSLTQILLFAFIWTHICKIIRKDNEGSFKLKAFQIIFTIIITLIPINFMLSITVWKDVLYTYFILLLLAYIYIGIKVKYDYSYFEMSIISLLLIAIMKMRHNGLPIGIIMIGILLILNYIKNKRLKKTAVFILIFAISFVVLSLPQWCSNVTESKFTSTVFTSTKVYCMGALLNADIEVMPEEKTFLDNILNTEEWKKLYNPYCGLYILYDKGYNSEFVNNNINEFSEIFYKYAKQNKKILIKHFIEQNSIDWSIKERGCLTIFNTNNNVTAENFGQQYATRTKSEFLQKGFMNIVQKTLNNKYLYQLLYRPATLMYISILLIIFIIINRKKLDYILLLFPMGINIGTYIITIASQDMRYFYPNFVTCYFIILIFGNIVIKDMKKVKKVTEKGKI